MQNGRLELAEESRIREMAVHPSGFRLQEALLRRRGEPLTEVACPKCRRDCDVQSKHRKLLLRRGEPAWTGPKSHCPVCQRDFFPLASCVEG
ncbi:MAG: hypothetical protein ACE5KM_09695 [Planctomycetaceae bacterium]